MPRVSNVAEPADIVPCLRELHDEASISVNPVHHTFAGPVRQNDGAALASFCGPG